MSTPETYGRNRQSIADLEQDLYDIFQDHPQCQFNDSSEPVIPGDALVDVLRTFSSSHNAAELMTRDEEEQLTTLIASNPGLQVTPQVLMQFIAMQTTISPRHTPEESPPPSGAEADFDERGRSEERDYDDGMNSRSSSRDSNATYYRTSSRGPPPPPKTPRDSVFDTGRRQRTTPLNNNQHIAPSSWSRRPPPSRRKSDAGHSRSASDSESVTSPSSYNRTPGRSRAPSNPTSPTFSSPPLAKSISSPPFGATPSRPHSRAQSQPQSHFASFESTANDYYGSSPERELDHRQIGLMSPPPSDASFDDETPFHEQISSLPMPRNGDDSDSDDDIVADHLLGLVMDRSAASSTVSLDMQERIDALQRMNTDLGRKLLEAERTLQNRLADHEQELEEMQSRLEEARSELSATKREEKELRSKERTNSTQIAALESEIAKLQKSLDTARTSYQSLQKQYQEQCSESERYRNTLRRRDQEIKDFQEAANLQSLEAQKWAREQMTYEERIAILESELVVAQQAQAQLDEQKQENMMLKETIDRMRFDMDELRNSAHSLDKGGTGSGTASAHGSVSKSLGAELLSKMKDGRWDMEDEEDEEEQSSIEMDATPEEDETESEDYVQTIITRTKRKVASRATKIETLKIDEVKEYSDTGTQHEPDEFTSTTAVQTDAPPKILTASFSVQTEEPPVSTTSIQTELEPTPIPAVVITVEREIQTDEWQPEVSSSGQSTEDEDDALASSSSTLLPPTPRAQSEHLHPHTHDLPPAYDKVTGEDMALRVANETLKTWHPGLKLPIEPLVGGISEDVVEDWKALKEELGVECAAIEKLVEESARAGPGQARSSREGRAGRRKSGRFYNIYNTYVYGGDPDSGSGSGSIIGGQLLICVGASALVAFLMGQAMAPQYSIPGGVTYYDRAAWSSFNSMQAAGEGFAGDSTTAVWSFLGRLGGMPRAPSGAGPHKVAAVLTPEQPILPSPAPSFFAVSPLLFSPIPASHNTRPCCSTTPALPCRLPRPVYMSICASPRYLSIERSMLILCPFIATPYVPYCPISLAICQFRTSLSLAFVSPHHSGALGWLPSPTRCLYNACSLNSYRLPRF
ncbi:hypothetical protein C8Q80DRAFT_648387 [Daedaleopsis nitida]|nr:hypothetical protein C8Q80DRAFT_648387 [Daedaleopsis nitida]